MPVIVLRSFVFLLNKMLSELWTLLLPRWVKMTWSLSSLSQEIPVCLMNLCRSCSRGCALSIPLPCPGWWRWKAALGRCLGCVCALREEQLEGTPGDLWMAWAAAAASCGCVTVCVCCLNSFQFGSASIPGQQRTPMAGRWDDLPTFRCSYAPRDADVSDVSALAPSPLSTHRGFTWLNFKGWCSTKDPVGCSKTELVLQLGTVKWWELRQYCINDVLFWR